MRPQTFYLRLVYIFSVLLHAPHQVQADEKISYRRQIAPVLQTYCLGCHNRTDAEQGLSLQAAGDVRPQRVGDAGEAERCKVPDFAKAIGHEQKWKLHNNCL